MLAIYGKNQKDNISDAAKNTLKAILGTIADDYRANMRRKSPQGKR